MSVKGDLAYQGLEELLRADLAAHGAGRLTLRHGAHFAALYLDEAGLYVLAPDLLEPVMLIEALVERGLLDSEVLQRVRASQSSAGRILEQLVESGTLPQATLLDILALEVEDTVLDMILWSEGIYRFERAAIPSGATGLLARICVDPVGVAERALGRIEERRAIGDRLGDHALLFEPIAGELPPLAHPGDRLHEIYARVDGRTIVHEMALRMGTSRFEVLQGLARLHEAGLVRPVALDDIARAATDRALQGRHAVARALALQWAEAAPQDVAPLRKLGSLAQEAGDKDAELEALCAQGNLFIQQGDHAEALDVFTRAMRQSPADDVVLAGLRLAAEAAGDNDALVEGTLLTAQTKLDEGEAAAALEMLEPLLTTHPDNMAVHLLRARALVHTEKRSEFFEQAEVVGQVLSREGVHSATDRQVAEFFRETIAHLAPDRGDLLERFRTLYDPRSRRRRSMAMLGALVLVICSAGVYFWPESASSLLTRAQEAADAGDETLALQMIGQLVDRFPESPEAEQAYHLQRRLIPPRPTTNRSKQALKALEEDLLGKIPALTDSLAALPDQGAQGSVRAVLEPLRSTRSKSIRTKVLTPAVEALREHTERLQGAVLERVQVLAKTSGAHERLADDPSALGAFIAEATQMRDPSWMADVKASSELLYGIAKMHGDRELITKTQELARAAIGLDKAAEYYDGHIARVRRAHAEREIEEADRCCREDAPKLMVAGQLDQADAYYARLESLLERYAGDETYGSLVEGLQRRQLPQLIRARRAQIADIRRRLALAQKAEDAGNLDEAVGVYAALVKEYWLIRFENVCSLPLRVESTPPGARVLMDDVEVGRTPTIVRYAWGGKATLRLEAEGFEAATHALHTAEAKPPSSMHVALAPAPTWQAERASGGAARPLQLDGDVLMTDRRGMLRRLGGSDGTTRWTRDLTSLEGIRARPALADGVLYALRVDGRLFRLDPASGKVDGDVKLPRPFGDLASHGGRVALATAAGEVVIVEKGVEIRRDALGAVPTAGVVAAHGAFWIGTADGTVVRIDAAAGSRRVIPVTRGTAPILALASSPDGLLVTTSDGALLALDAKGDTRWTRRSIGDLVGDPAQTDGYAATVDRQGVVHVFRAEDGTPVRTLDTEGTPAGGVVGSGRTMLVLHADGMLRAFDPASGTLLLAHRVATEAAFEPFATSGASVLLPFGDDALAKVPVPQLRAP